MLKQQYKNFKNNTRTRQVAALFSVNIIGIPIGFITSIVVTRYLGAKGYGDFKFIQSIFNFAIIIFTFGFFQAGNRALVLNNDKQKAKEYYGAELVITGGLYIIMSFFLLMYALFDSNIQAKGLSNFLLFVIPFGWVFLLLRYFETLLQADNRIRLLAQLRLYPKIGFLIMAGSLYFIFRHLEINRLAVVMSFYLVTEIVVYIIILLKIKVSFKNFKKRFLEIWNYNKSFGINIYLGSLFAIGFSQFSQILISYFGIDNSGVGFYTLAITFTLPLTLIPNTIATTHYKDFSTYANIPKKLIIITVAFSLAALFSIWIIVPHFISYFYEDEFSSVITLNFIVSFGVVAHGFGDFFNRFLGANGQGVAIRNSAMIVGICVLLFNLLLIPHWGESGAAYTRLITGFIYLFMMLMYYFRYIKSSKKFQNHYEKQN